MIALRSRLALALAVVLLGCGSVTLSPDGGASGRAGHDGGAAGTTGGTGAAGSGGTSGSAGGGGTTGVAGSGGTTGVAGSGGTTGAAGSGGTTGAAGSGGTTGSAGTTGTAGTKGAGGKGGTGGACGPVCDIFCQYGNVLDANGCPTCECNPPPACTTDDCGPPPPFAAPYCPTGTIVGGGCARNTDGKCAWQPPTCKCPALRCDPSTCANGDVADEGGCATCTCKPPATCPAGTTPGSCPAVSCATSCAEGYALDANGCQTCGCLSAATCAGLNILCKACPYGFRTGPNGCRSCACAQQPPGCAPSATTL
jgi:hypothetical protein